MRRLVLLPLVLGVLVATALPAFAHASFDVTELPAGSSQDVLLRIPLERDADNALVEVLVPGAFTVTACPAAEGWSCTQQTTTDGDVVLTIARDDDGPGDTERFGITLTAPSEEGVYPFPTIQTYTDDVEAAWINDPGTDRPAPRIQVGDSTSEVAFADDASPHTATLDDEQVDDASEPATDGATEDEPADEPDATPSPIEVEGDPTPADEATDAPADDAEEEVAAPEDADDGDADDEGGAPVLLLVLAGLAGAGIAAAVVTRMQGRDQTA